MFLRFREFDTPLPSGASQRQMFSPDVGPILDEGYDLRQEVEVRSPEFPAVELLGRVYQLYCMCCTPLDCL